MSLLTIRKMDLTFTAHYLMIRYATPSKNNNYQLRKEMTKFFNSNMIFIRIFLLMLCLVVTVFPQKILKGGTIKKSFTNHLKKSGRSKFHLKVFIWTFNLILNRMTGSKNMVNNNQIALRSWLKLIFRQYFPTHIYVNVDTIYQF